MPSHSAPASLCCVTEAGSYLRLIDFCITQLKAQGPSRTYNESKEKEEEHLHARGGVVAHHEHGLRVRIAWPDACPPLCNHLRVAAPEVPPVPLVFKPAKGNLLYYQ